MSDFTYSELISRNYAYINEELQTKIEQTRLVFIGCGLSSGIVEDFARIGFAKFVLIDFDVVELSNMNRQHYYFNEVGLNKSEVLRGKVLEINPEAKVEAINRKISGAKDIDWLLCNADIVINTIDFGEDYFNLVSQAQKKGVLAICPLNLGFGGMITCFNKYSGTFYDLLGVDQPETRNDFYLRLFIRNRDKLKIAEYFYKNLITLSNKIQQIGYQPQMCIGANIVSALLITTVVKYLNNDRISLAPEIIYKDFFNI